MSDLTGHLNAASVEEKKLLLLETVVANQMQMIDLLNMLNHNVEELMIDFKDMKTLYNTTSPSTLASTLRLVASPDPANTPPMTAGTPTASSAVAAVGSNNNNNAPASSFSSLISPSSSSCLQSASSTSQSQSLSSSPSPLNSMNRNNNNQQQAFSSLPASNNYLFGAQGSAGDGGLGTSLMNIQQHLSSFNAAAAAAAAAASASFSLELSTAGNPITKNDSYIDRMDPNTDQFQPIKTRLRQFSTYVSKQVRQEFGSDYLAQTRINNLDREVMQRIRDQAVSRFLPNGVSPQLAWNHAMNSLRQMRHRQLKKATQELNPSVRYI